MIFNKILINNTWLIIWFIGSFFTYFLWICPEWNSQRIKFKLTNSTGIDYNIKQFIKFKYYIIRTMMFIFCIGISFIITIMFWYSAKGKPINDLYDVISIYIPIVLFYMLLSGIKEHESDIENNQLKLILSLKIKILEIFIGFEKKVYIKSIHKIIRKWYKNDKVNHKFAALIIRMSHRTFVDILKDACNLNVSVSKSDGAIKSILYEKPLEIMEDYYFSDTNMNVLTNIQQLIDTYFELDNCEPYKITNFISNHEISCKNNNKESILENIGKLIGNTGNDDPKNNSMKTDKFDSLFVKYEFDNAN